MRCHVVCVLPLTHHPCSLTLPVAEDEMLEQSMGVVGELAGYTPLFICAGLVVLSGLLLFRARPS